MTKKQTISSKKLHILTIAVLTNTVYLLKPKEFNNLIKQNYENITKTT